MVIAFRKYMTSHGLWTLCDAPTKLLDFKMLVIWLVVNLVQYILSFCMYTFVEFGKVFQFLCGSLCVLLKTFEVKYLELCTF